VVFQSLNMSFTVPFNELVKLGTDYQDAKGFLDQLEDVQRYRHDAAAVEPTQAGRLRLQGRVTLEGVGFGYNPLGKPLIDNFSLDIQPGRRVAVVGPSGSGKSTVAKLVSGLFRPTSGRVLLDGKPRDAYAEEDLVGAIAYVDQDISLFEGRIRDNLTLWDDTVPEPRLSAAAADAEILDTIKARPGHFHAPILENGLNFSGGQRQRLEIARALITDPGILVLDEATSALDPETERKIDRNIRKRGCTCLIVAHRLSTVRDCDEIIVMDKGRVVQRGLHEHLIAEPGLYADLVATM